MTYTDPITITFSAAQATALHKACLDTRDYTLTATHIAHTLLSQQRFAAVSKAKLAELHARIRKQNAYAALQLDNSHTRKIQHRRYIAEHKLRSRALSDINAQVDTYVQSLRDTL